MKITYRDYCDKVKGCWLGKSAGGIIGFKQESNKSLLHYNFDNVFPDILPPNDDFDLQVLYLFEVLEKKGANFDSYDLGKAFAKRNKCWANEYRVAIDNIDSGINPPYSGTFNNEYFLNSMGCPIRSELWALISPNNPELACKFAQMDGSIDHGRESIQAERFLARIESQAFFVKDLQKIIRKEVQNLDRNSQLYAALTYLFEQYETGIPWQELRNRLVKNFGSCDATYSVINLSFMVLALLYGECDFEKTLLHAVNCGFDTDCTSATVGAILGLYLGYDKIPEHWKKKVGDVFFAGTADVDQSRNTYQEVADVTVNVGLRLIQDRLNDQCVVLDVPEDLELFIPAYENNIQIEFKYLNDLDIQFGEEKEVALKLVNSNDKAKKVRVSVECAENISASFKEEIILNDIAETILKFKMNQKAELSGKIINTVHIRCDEKLYTYQIGFIPVSQYKLYGPFFDNYDTNKFPSDPYNELQQTDENGNVDLFPMFNGYVDIKNEYLKNDKVEGVQPDTVFGSHHNLLDIESQINYKGPCCIYLEREVFSDSDQICLILIGNNDAFKVYLNDELVGESNQAVYWCMSNFQFFLNLKKGINKLVFKLIRRNAPLEFSAMFSKYIFGNGVHVDLKK